MKKSTISALIPFLIIIFLIPCFTIAQDDDGDNTVLMVKYQTVYHDDFSYAKLDSLNELYNENVIKKNKHIVSEMILTHYYGASSDDYYIITEYNGSGLDIVELANKESTRLYKEWMPEAEDREAFFEYFTKSFTTWHSDEIMTMLNKMTH